MSSVRLSPGDEETLAALCGRPWSFLAGLFESDDYSALHVLRVQDLRAIAGYLNDAHQLRVSRTGIVADKH